MHQTTSKDDNILLWQQAEASSELLGSNELMLYSAK